MSATKPVHPEASSDMEAAVAAFKDWRKNRKKLCRIPAPLWELAANLSKHNPISTICQNLGLNWGVLRKKIDQLSSPASASNLEPPSFVELELKGQGCNPLSPFTFSSTAPPTRCAVELTRPDGTIMKIFASNDVPLNLLELCNAFLKTNQ